MISLLLTICMIFVKAVVAMSKLSASLKQPAPCCCPAPV